MSAARTSTVRVVAIIGAPVAVVSALLVTVAIHLTPFAGAGGPTLPWPVLAALFAIAQASVVNIQVGREARSVSLSDAPFVLGLFLVPAGWFAIARVLGGAVAQVVARRQHREPLKLLFNTVTFAAEAAVGLLTFLLLDGGAGPQQPRAWIAAVAGATAANVVSGVLVAVLIARLERHVSARQLLVVAGTCGGQAAVTACAGLVAAVAVQVSPWIGVPLVVMCVTVGAGYRAYARLVERHESLGRLYRFSQVIGAHQSSDQVLRGMLEQLSEMLLADGAALTLIDDDEEPESEAWLRRGGEVERRPPKYLTGESRWILDILTREQRPVLLARETRDPAAMHWLRSAGLQEAMLVPLRGDQRVIGALMVCDRLGAARGFDSGDLQLLETVANHAAIALRNGQLMDRLRHDSLHDALTGVANRTYLQHELDRLLADTAHGGSPFALAMLDLDAFKDVNDTLGHQQGDRLLSEVARRLTLATSGRGLVTRFGGDEFALVLPHCFSDESAVRTARALLELLSAPVDLDGVTVEVGASIGIACAPRHATTSAELVKRADVAMYVAKQAGREVVVYEEAHDNNSPSRLELVASLRAAINDRLLDIHVQPQFDVLSGLVVGAEALVRWDDPQRGRIPPDEFIPLAERSGLIRPLTDVVLEKAVAACAAWQADAPCVAVSVNLSARSLHDEGLEEQIGRLLDRYALSPRLLTLEITESSVMADPARTLGLLHRLRLRGIRLSIDDFGTGYSSLSYLRRLPVQEVKVDRSFVQRMHLEVDDASIVRSIIELARTLDLSVVAEGVETEEGWRLLRELGCDQAQGYFLARPMPVAEFATWRRAVRAEFPRQRLVAIGDA